MGVDALKVAQHVEMQRAGLDAFYPSQANASEMGLRRARLEIPEDLLFAEQTASRTRVIGYEHRSRGMHITDHAIEHGADLGLAFNRKGEASLEPLGGDRHQIVLHNVAGVLEVGDKSEDFR